MPAESKNWRDELLAAGWAQGSLVPAKAELHIKAWFHPEGQGLRHARKAAERIEREGSGLKKPESFIRPVKDDQRLVVLTQTCDLVKPPDEFPLVDLGLVISTENPRLLAESDNYGSARRYRLTPRDKPPPALVLDYGWRTHIDKGVLTSLNPDNSVVSTWNLADRERFARWLGRRYARPVLSDKDTEQIHNPIREAWRAVGGTSEEELAKWSNAFSELRYERNGDSGVHLYVLTASEDPDIILGSEFVDWLSEAIETRSGLSVEGEVESYYNFSVAQHESSIQLDLEWASDDEGELVGPIPSEP